MSYQIADLGNAMYTDWEKPIRDAHFQNMLSYQKSTERAKVNGEICFRNCQNVKNSAMGLNLKGRGLSENEMGAKNNNGRAREVKYRQSTNGWVNNQSPISHRINPNAYSPITKGLVVRDDPTLNAYRTYWSNLQKNKGMADSVQDPTSNYPCKQYMKY